MSQFKKYLEIIQEMNTEVKSDDLIEIIYDQSGKVQKKIKILTKSLKSDFITDMVVEYKSKQTPIMKENAKIIINKIIKEKNIEIQVLDIKNAFIELLSNKKPSEALNIKKEMKNIENKYVIHLCDAIIGSLTGEINQWLIDNKSDLLIDQKEDFNENSINKIKVILIK